MADLDPIINDEQALSYVEGMENWTRGLKHIGAVVRFVRNSRKEIPSLKNEVDGLHKSRESAKHQCDEAARASQKRMAELEKETNRLLADQADKADMVRLLKQEVASLTTSRDALKHDVEESGKLLSETQKSIGKLVKEESDLSSRVTALKQEMDRIERTLPTLLGR